MNKSLLEKLAAGSVEVEPPRFNSPTDSNRPKFHLPSVGENGVERTFPKFNPPTDSNRPKFYLPSESGQTASNKLTLKPGDKTLRFPEVGRSNPSKVEPKGPTLKNGDKTYRFPEVGRSNPPKVEPKGPTPKGELGMMFDDKKRTLKNGGKSLRPKNKDGFYAGVGEKAIAERQRMKELEIPEFFKKTSDRPTLKNGDKKYRFPEVGRSNKTQAQQTAKKVEQTVDSAKKSEKAVENTVKASKKLGKAGKFGLAALGAGAVAGGAKALYDKNKQKKENEQIQSVAGLLDEAYMEKQANLLSNIGNTLGTAARNGNLISTVKNGLNNGAKAIGTGALGQAQQLGGTLSKFQKPLAGVGAAGAFGPLGMVAGLAGLKKMADENIEEIEKEAALGGVAGLANDTNPSPFAKATVKGMGESVATSMSPTPNVTSGATSGVSSVKAPTSMSTGGSNIKQAEEVIDSFEKMLEKTASEYLSLSEDELQAPISETMAIRRQYRELFNSNNINW